MTPADSTQTVFNKARDLDEADDALYPRTAARATIVSNADKIHSNAALDEPATTPKPSGPITQRSGFAEQHQAVKRKATLMTSVQRLLRWEVIAVW